MPPGEVLSSSGPEFGSFEACATPARAEESGRFVLTSRFSWAIESLSPDRAGLEAPEALEALEAPERLDAGPSDFERPEPERDELEEGEEALELEARPDP
jgi:hypothetical protein